MSLESDLKITGISFPMMSCRGAIQTLKPIQHGEMKRSVNGDLCYVGVPSHHKYQSTITCTDKNVPGLHQLWVGAEVTIQSLTTLWEKCILTEERTHKLSRPIVKNSLYALEIKTCEDIECALTEEGHLQLPQGNGKEVLVSYRPILKMRIASFSFQDAEWEKEKQWVLELEEI